MNDIDVLLINLPTVSSYKKKFSESNGMPPLGLIYIGTFLEKNGYNIKIIDFSVEFFNKNKIITYLKEANPKLIGMSTYNESWDAQKVLVKLIKKILPDSIIFAGGAFATFCYEDILNQTDTDFVIRGEGEYSTLKLCNILLKGEKGRIENIPGIVFNKKSGEIYINYNIERIKDLNELPIPNRELVNLSNYLVPFTISTSRGCPGNCIFCSSRAFWGKKVYVRDARSVFHEVMYLYKKYDNIFFYIADDTFTASSARAMEFCGLLDNRNIEFVWGCESRADVINEKLISKMSESGCKKIQIGLESADNEILYKLKKNVNIEQIHEGIRLAEKYGMHISVSFIIGHAYDTEDSIRKTLQFAKFVQDEYGAYVMGSINTPFPGTEQFNKAKELGIKIYSKNWSDFRLNNPIIRTNNFSQSELRNWYEKVVEVMNRNNNLELKK